MLERNLMSSQHRVVGRMAAAFLVSVVIGCKSEKKTAEVDTSPTDTSMVAADTPTVASDPGMDDIPGRDTARTRAYLAELRPQWTTAPERVTLHCEEGECAGNPTAHLEFFTHPLTLQVDAAKIVDKATPEMLRIFQATLS